LDVIDQRRRRIETLDRRKGRLRTRLPALALERLEERRLLAADVRAGAAMDRQRDVPEQAVTTSLLESGGEHVVLRRVLAADVDEHVLRRDRVRRDQAAFDQPVR